MKKISCSVPILTLNAEKNLDQCLASLVDFEDVYLVDGNSTDHTHEIAKKYGRPIYKQVETDELNVRIKDFTAARKHAYSLAKNDWLLDLDSDEFLTPELVEEIQVTLEKYSDIITRGYTIEGRYIFAGHKVEHAFFYPIQVLRLYNRKSGIGLTDGKTLHESVTVPEGVEEKKLTNILWSYGPDSYKESVEKDNRYLAIVNTKILSFKVISWRSMRMSLFSAIENILRAVYVLTVSVFIMGRYGYTDSLPWSQVFRHVRYDFHIALLRIKQVFILFHYLLIKKK